MLLAIIVAQKAQGDMEKLIKVEYKKKKGKKGKEKKVVDSTPGPFTKTG